MRKGLSLMAIANPVSSDSSNHSSNSKWRLEWWGFVPIPIPVSWIREDEEHIPTLQIQMENNSPPGPPSYRDREGENLDDTWPRYNNRQRRYDDSQQPPQPPKIQVPISVIITVVFWSIAQLVGGVWWAATLQSDLRHEIADRSKEEERLWENIQTYRLEVQALRVDLARSQTTIRQLKEEN